MLSNNCNNKIQDAIGKIRQKITQASEKECINKEIQVEVGKLLSLLERINQLVAKVDTEQEYLLSMIQDLDSAAIVMLQDKPNVESSKEIRRELEFQVDRRSNLIAGIIVNFFRRFNYLSSTPTKVLIGLIISLPFYAALSLIIPKLLPGGAVTFMEQAPVVAERKTTSENQPEIIWKKTTSENQLEIIWKKTTSQKQPECNEAYIVENLIKLENTGSGHQELVKKLREEYLLEDYLPLPEDLPTLCNQIYQTRLQDFQDAIKLIYLAGLAGGVGSIISIVSRLKEYDSEKYGDSFLPIFVGIVKPIIGVSFGILLFTLVRSGTFFIQEPEGMGHQQCFYLSIAFIAGFSERFAKDVVSRAESTFTGEPCVTTEEEKRQIVNR